VEGGQQYSGSLDQPGRAGMELVRPHRESFGVLGFRENVTQAVSFSARTNSSRQASESLRHLRRRQRWIEELAHAHRERPSLQAERA